MAVSISFFVTNVKEKHESLLVSGFTVDSLLSLKSMRVRIWLRENGKVANDLRFYGVFLQTLVSAIYRVVLYLYYGIIHGNKTSSTHLSNVCYISTCVSFWQNTRLKCRLIQKQHTSLYAERKAALFKNLNSFHLIW